ncbi:MAG: hypothetical protein QX198_14825 [Methylococcaceae bacterium]
MLHLVAVDEMTMGTICEICINRDDALEYKHGGAVIVPVCMYNRANFNLVKRYDQCRFFSNINQQETSNADTDIPEQLARSACDRDYRPSAASSD